MSNTPHTLHDEFPADAQKMSALKASDAHFAKLLVEYDVVNDKVHRAETRLDLVTETWPPEVNGVAMTLSTLVAGLRARGHDVTVVRPRQPADGPARASEGTLLRPGLPLLLYSDLRLGWPCARFLARRWTRRRRVPSLRSPAPIRCRRSIFRTC